MQRLVVCLFILSWRNNSVGLLNFGLIRFKVALSKAKPLYRLTGYRFLALMLPHTVTLSDLIHLRDGFTTPESRAPEVQRIVGPAT